MDGGSVKQHGFPRRPCRLVTDAATLEHFRLEATARRGHEPFGAEVRQSQARHRIVCEARRNGADDPWGGQPLRDTSEHDMHTHMALNILE
ncbi:MAG: hypothetical protein JKY00_06415 [Roseicyclus sp.]|nr:hypothetical protein [Roseicyclus sp.]